MSFLNRISQNQFGVKVYKSTQGLLDLKNYELLHEIKSSCFFFKRNPTVIVADPFLFSYDNVLFLFYEEQVNLRGKGIIKMTRTEDLLEWTEPITVLDEKFHLSFPFVFRDRDKILMIPETGEANIIQAYVAKNPELTKWEPYKIILKGGTFVDSSIYSKDKLYYLFTTEIKEDRYSFRIFMSDSIESPSWTEHTLSPIATDLNKARCGGSVFLYEKQLYRPVQRCNPYYGSGLDLYRIKNISPDLYTEEKVMNIIPGFGPSYAYGGHHFNYCVFHDDIIVSLDYLKRNFNFQEILRRSCDKILNNESK